MQRQFARHASTFQRVWKRRDWKKIKAKPKPEIPVIPRVSPDAPLAEKREFLNNLKPLLPTLDEHGFSHHAYLYPGIERRPVIPDRIRPSRNIPVEDALGSEFTVLKVEPLPKPRKLWTANRFFSLEQRWYVSKYAKLFEETNFLLCFQHNMNSAELAAFKRTIQTASEGRLTMNAVLKTELCRHALEFMNDGKYAALAPVFRGPTSIVYSRGLPFELNDLHVLLKQQADLFYLGGLVESQVVHHENIKSIAEATSLLSVRSNLISTMQSPYQNLIRTLKNPLDNLVKVLQAAEKKAGNEAAASEQNTAAAEAPAAEAPAAEATASA